MIEVYQQFGDIFSYGTILLSTISHSDRFFRNNSVHLFEADFREGWIVPDGQWGKKGKTLLSTINLDKPLSLSPAVFSNHCLLYKYGSFHSSVIYHLFHCDFPQYETSDNCSMLFMYNS